MDKFVNKHVENSAAVNNAVITSLRKLLCAKKSFEDVTRLFHVRMESTCVGKKNFGT